MQPLPSARLLLAGALFLCLGVLDVVQAQSPPAPASQQPTTTFTATTDLVLVPVVVRQGKQHVSGLTKDDFVVLEDKVPQRLAFAKPTTPGTAFTRLGGGNVFTNQFQGDGEAPRLTVIAVDTINTPFAHQAWVIQEVHRFLADSPRLREPTAIIGFTKHGIRVIHDFTTDTASLLAAFELASGQKPSRASVASAAATSNPPAPHQKSSQVLGVLSWVEPGSLEASDARLCVDRLTRSLEGLAVVAQSLSGIPGRKTLLWITGAFPFSGFDRPETFLTSDIGLDRTPVSPRKGSTVPSADGLTAELPGQSTRSDLLRCELRKDELLVLRPLYERTVKELADANVAVYPIDSRGVVVTFPGADAQLNVRRDLAKGNLDLGGEAAGEEFWIRTSMQRFAEMTGATPCYHSNYFSNCLRDAVADSESYYLLGFYRDKKNDKPGWRALKVEAKRPGVEVLARSGYFYLPEAHDTKEARQRDVSFALISPIDFSGVVFSVALKQTAGADPKLRTLQFQLQIPPSSLMDDPSGNHRMSLELVAAASRPQGGLVDKFSKNVEGTLNPQTANSILKNGLSYSDSLRVPPGELTLRFIVRDNVNGRVGSVVVPFTVQ